MTSSFAAVVNAWAYRLEGAIETIFKESCQELVSQLNALVPVDTGFLRNSLRASTTAMPVLSLANNGQGNIPAGEIMLVIAGADIGDTIYLGYTANYGAFVHYGANGRPGRPWVDLVAQRWASIVAEKSAEVKSRLGL